MPPASPEETDFETLLTFLNESRGFDFTGYKRTTLTRRVGRRMQQVGITSVVDYLDYLQVHQDEFAALFNTILINVTGFFRDADVWTYLRENALPELLAAREPSAPLRVWSAGCASGEEAYTLVMVLADLIGPEEVRDRVKIYATDVDEAALADARLATYAAADLSAVPPAYREAYFEAHAERFTFRKDLRRTVIFGRNDLVQDAPISRVDLLVCRNTLMYFNAETQARIVGRFHFALADSGVLVLGKAEMLRGSPLLFTPIDVKKRLFRRAAGARPRHDGALAVVPAVDPPALVASDVGRLRFEALLSSPVATLLVAADGTLAFANQRADALFTGCARDVGRPFRDLEISYRPAELRSSLTAASVEGRTVWVKEVEWPTPGGESTYLDVQVVPLISGDTDIGAALFFTDVSHDRRLRMELEYANRQLETAYAELQSTVEELETTNEELQSTNEELETTNEELQSTNDELHTINDELRGRTQELDETSAFMESILRSLRTAVTVVDRNLVIRIWNWRAEDMWGLRPDEAIGQHLLNLDIGLPTEELRPIVRQALSGSAEPAEIRLPAMNRKGRTVSIQVTVSPLRTNGEEPTGAILVIDEQAEPAN